MLKVTHNGRTTTYLENTEELQNYINKTARTGGTKTIEKATDEKYYIYVIKYNENFQDIFLIEKIKKGDK